ncbi:MAG: IS110 family RNA-guided transposase [Candidatus Thorarchaeota archaeon]
MPSSIFKNAGTDLRDVLTSCELGEILYASIDVAKYNHSAMIVNFFGDVIIPEFDFPYNNHGINFLRKKLQLAQKQTQAKKLFLGLESTGHYHENLVASLGALGYDVQIIRPIDSNHERDNVHAKTDEIDLAAIAKVIISNKGTRSHMPDPIYYNLRRASRTHRQLTWQETKIKNIITMLVDKTFGTLWNPDNSIFSDKWGKASLLFIQNYSTPQQAIKMGAKRLATFFQKHNTKLGIDTASKIIALAKITPARPLEEMESDIKALKAYIQILKALTSAILDQRKQMVKFLLQTPGTCLLSVPGVSVVYASDFTAEVGDVHRFAYANQMISLAGTAPRKYQSGEADKANLPTSHKGKNFLRTTVNQIALSLNAHCPEYHQYYSKKRFQYKDAPGKARTATANRFIKLAFALMKNETLYYPRTANLLNSEKEHYQSIWGKMKKKVTPYLCDDIPLNNYLTKTQHELEEKYGITP